MSSLYLAFHGITYDYYHDSVICYGDCYLVNDLILFALEFLFGKDILLFVDCNIFRIMFVVIFYFTRWNQVHDVRCDLCM